MPSEFSSLAFAVSYDGKRGDKSFGKELPSALNLKKIEIEVGRSSQATLLGREEVTVESLYLSQTIVDSYAVNLESYISRTHIVTGGKGKAE